MGAIGDILGFGDGPDYEFLNGLYDRYFQRQKQVYQNRLFPIIMQNWRRMVQGEQRALDAYRGSQRGSLQSLRQQEKSAIGRITNDLASRGLSSSTIAPGYKQDIKRDYSMARSQVQGDYASGLAALQQRLGAARGSKPAVSFAMPEINLMRGMAQQGLFTGFKENPSTWQQMGGLGGLLNFGSQALGLFSGFPSFGGGAAPMGSPTAMPGFGMAMMNPGMPVPGSPPSGWGSWGAGMQNPLWGGQSSWQMALNAPRY